MVKRWAKIHSDLRLKFLRELICYQKKVIMEQMLSRWVLTEWKESINVQYLLLIRWALKNKSYLTNKMEIWRVGIILSKLISDWSNKQIKKIKENKSLFLLLLIILSTWAIWDLIPLNNPKKASYKFQLKKLKIWIYVNQTKFSLKKVIKRKKFTKNFNCLSYMGVNNY